MTPEEHLFRSFEEHILAITQRYPEPVHLEVSGRSASHTRQQLKLAMECYLSSPAIASEVPRTVVENILSLWVFSNTLDRIYIGPRKRRAEQRKFLIAHSSAPSSSPPIPPIDCTLPEVFSACCVLKNLDAFPLPLTLTNVPESYLTHARETYPNIEFVQDVSSPGTYLIL